MSYPNQYQYSPQQPPAKKGPSWVLIALGVLGGGAVLAIALCCGSLAYMARPPVASAAAKQPFSLEGVPVWIEERGNETQADYAPGVTQRVVSLGSDAGYYDLPGQGGSLYIWLPQREHSPKSLPCVLITGAGSDLLSGMQLGDGDFDEQIPYAQAGYAVVGYELDGPNDLDGDPEAMRKAFAAFQASRAGLVNARNALEYVLAKMPEIDPARIYAAGHSSAGTHALLFAEHEPRLAGVIAFAPAVDLPQWFAPRLRLTSFLVPGCVDFLTQSSPSTHRERLKCATFLFHSAADDVCEIGQTRTFAQQLKEQGTDTTFVEVQTGDHYNSMIEEGIPAAIKWLRARDK